MTKKNKRPKLDKLDEIPVRWVMAKVRRLGRAVQVELNPSRRAKKKAPARKLARKRPAAKKRGGKRRK